MSTEREVRVVDLRVGDLIKSHDKSVPPARVTRSPRSYHRRHVEWQDTHGSHDAIGASMIIILDEGQSDE